MGSKEERSGGTIIGTIAQPAPEIGFGDIQERPSLY
jgi:hypothetical protein